MTQSALRHRLARSVASAALLATVAVAGASVTAANAVAATASASPAGTTVAVGDPIAITFYLPLRNAAGAEAQARSIQSAGSASYHKFMTVSQFVAAYGPTQASINNLQARLEGMGFKIEYVYPNNLAVEATSLAGNVQSTLGVTLKRMTVAGHTGVVSTTPVTVPASLQNLVMGIGGLDTLRHAVSHRVRALEVPAASSGADQVLPSAPGTYLPADFATLYNVNPLYTQGLTGSGTTIGIVTLNDFDPADAYDFWKQIGLNVSQTRITKVNVDGGLTASSNNSEGEGETDLDVEQSGAIAPGANMRVYIAPNLSTANFINGFEAAASDNIVDTVSSSWGQPELDFLYGLTPQSPGTQFLLQAFHAVFLEMALQGQTLFIAAGDSGSYDTVRGCPFYGVPTATAPTCNAPFAVDHPSADPLVTAAGGTSVPFSFTSKRSGIHFFVNQEQAWSWRYLATEAAQQGLSSKLAVPDVFSVGDGGGVSSYFTLPWYQFGVGGTMVTKPNQSLTMDSGQGPVTQVVLPSYFFGRNLPDISTNADPESGYQVLEEGSISIGNGGTSFVAPQLNGVNALFTQGLGGRVGQINPALYLLGGLASKDNATGDNWGYVATKGFDQATGVGTLDATKLLSGLRLLNTVHF